MILKTASSHTICTCHNSSDVGKYVARMWKKNLKNFDLTRSIFVMLKQHWILQSLDYELINCLWNEFKNMLQNILGVQRSMTLPGAGFILQCLPRVFISFHHLSHNPASPAFCDSHNKIWQFNIIITLPSKQNIYILGLLEGLIPFPQTRRQMCAGYIFDDIPCLSNMADRWCVISVRLSWVNIMREVQAKILTKVV